MEMIDCCRKKNRYNRQIIFTNFKFGMNTKSYNEFKSQFFISYWLHTFKTLKFPLDSIFTMWPQSRNKVS